jgi:hypothetical protein
MSDMGSTVLVRQETEDEASDTVSNSTAPQEIGTEVFEEHNLVTSLACPNTKTPGGNEVFFVGKEDSAVYLHETRTGNQIRKLFDHGSKTPISWIFFG